MKVYAIITDGEIIKALAALGKKEKIAQFLQDKTHFLHDLAITCTIH
jgi:hypothetical protein